MRRDNSASGSSSVWFPELCRRRLSNSSMSIIGCRFVPGSCMLPTPMLSQLLPLAMAQVLPVVKGSLLARWPITFMVRISLAHEFSVRRATEVTLTREVINVRRNVYAYDQIAVAGHARWRRLAFRLGKGQRADEKSECGRYYQFCDHSGASET